uniref:Uncharacterized protein n=1 Tax=Panagrolaimus sp. JU765 TaxID=591449 RepID=A0AC34R9L0_9BILA
MTERDSLNSYNGEDDYGEYEEDDDEIFEEVDSPIQGLQSTTDYVNFTAFCNVKEPSSSSLHVYSDIIRTAPELPRHQPLLQFEQRLFRTAEKCLSIVGETGPSSSGEQNGNFLTTPKRNIRTSEESNPRQPSSAGSLPSRESQPDSGFGRSSTEQQNHVSPASQLERPPEGMVLAHPPVSSPVPRMSSAASDYAIPPDASRTMRSHTLKRENHPEYPPTIRTSVIPSSDQEMSGYLTAMSENRLRSLKRRYVILKNTQLKFYRTQKHFSRDETPTMTVNLREVKAVSKASTKSGGQGFEIVLENESLRYQAESDKITDEWFTVLNQILKNLTIADLAQRSKPIEAELAGWVTKVKHGHQKRYYAQLTGEKLLFFKKPDDKIPHSHQNLRGARITEKAKSSSDEYSASSGDEQNEIGAIRASGNGSSTASAIYNNCGDSDYSICVEAVDSDPQYLILRSSEDKDRWLYYLRLAARNAALCGTSFEIFVERLMAEPDPLNSELWNDVLLKSIEEQPTETLTTIEDPDLRKKALELDLAAYLFTSVQMRPIAIQYHVDLSQNLLSSALEHPSLQNELYAQLIRLTSGSMEFGYQAWKLMSMVIPLYLPKQYSLSWLLKQHVERIRRKTDGKAEQKLADYCHQALNRRQKIGDRREGPSKLEALSILTRDPTNTILPYSIAVKLPTGDHHVIEFDGSTEIGQCLSSLCLKLNLRPALLSGYSLYANDPTGGSDDLVLLKGKQKLCDCLSLWERQMKDGKSGRITTDACSIKLQLRLKNYWTSLSDDETPNEKLFLCHRLADEVVAGHLPLSNDLAEELCALRPTSGRDSVQILSQKVVGGRQSAIVEAVGDFPVDEPAERCVDGRVCPTDPDRASEVEILRRLHQRGQDEDQRPENLHRVERERRLPALGPTRSHQKLPVPQTDQFRRIQRRLHAHRFQNFAAKCASRRNAAGKDHNFAAKCASRGNAAGKDHVCHASKIHRTADNAFGGVHPMPEVALENISQCFSLTAQINLLKIVQ